MVSLISRGGSDLNPNVQYALLDVPRAACGMQEGLSTKRAPWVMALVGRQPASPPPRANTHDDYGAATRVPTQ